MNYRKIALWMSFIIMAVSVVCLANVSAWSSNTFNNSLTNENLTFTLNQSVTRWLSIPYNFLVHANMNLSFINQSSQLTCYQETANVSDCGERNLGEYWEGSSGVMWSVRKNPIDGDWSTSAVHTFANSASWRVNYTKLKDRFSNNITWEVKETSGIYNLSVPEDCTNAFVEHISFKFASISDGSTYWWCRNKTGDVILKTGTGEIFEEGIYWGTSQNNTVNTNITIGKKQIWHYSDEFNRVNNRTDNFASIVREFLNETYLVGSNYLIPILFHSDKYGILQYLDISFDSLGLLENSQNYSNPVYEMSQTVFSINVSYDSLESSSILGTLVYNGTSYLGASSGSGTNKIFSKIIDIPAVNNSVNNSFYWSFSITNSSGTSFFNSSWNNQTVNPINFSYCTSGGNVVNFSIRDEENNSFLPSNFKASFVYTTTQFSLYKKTVSVDLTGSSSYSFCTAPNTTYYVQDIISLSRTDYDTRDYNLAFESYSNNTPTNVTLYLLNSTSARDVIIEVKDTGLSPLQGYTVKIYRYQAVTNSYILVEEDVTDVFGQIVASLVENNAKYQFKFYNSTGTLLKSTGDVVISCRSTICVQPFVIKEADTSFERFTNVTSYEYSLSFVNTTNTFTFAWTDNTGGSPNHRLLVTRFLMNGTQTVCNSQSSVLSGSLNCAVGNNSYSYTAQAFRTINGKETRIALLEHKVNPPSDTFGLEGLFWSFILLFTVIIIGIYSPILGIILYLIGLVALGLVGVVYIDPVLIIAQIALGVAFVWAFRG